ncbi:TonB family protein [Sandaracinobacter sp. RS1-74]|uniref:energy transducer TonB n=1 Tax=Sandaracinobacteroides sayramensis TaxID=2913411 RepID=UPI001EDC6326|nr:TonB family protein [Sandaracinobacteroides sayramensis]MCG2840686.1 TonB family protein [Sandaracinobacteroides sayramensis]
MPLGTRLIGMGGTGLVGLLLIGAALFKWHGTYQKPQPATLSVFDVAPPEAPPAPDTEIPPGPEQVQKAERRKAEVVEVPPPLVHVPSASAMRAPAAEPVDDPGPPVDQTTAPETRPLPPGSKASDTKPTWEGQVLAALNAAKRYPLEARRNRQQGIPWIRFLIDREGRVRSVRLERPSGFDALDREALALPMRAQPLPKPPESVPGDRIELTVPVEFFLS